MAGLGHLPSTGEIVLYSLDDGPHEGEVRPAIVVNTRPPGGGITLMVFIDGDRDDPVRPMPGGLVRWIPNANSGTTPGTYRRRENRRADAD